MRAGAECRVQPSHAVNEHPIQGSKPGEIGLVKRLQQ